MSTLEVDKADNDQEGEDVDGGDKRIIDNLIREGQEGVNKMNEIKSTHEAAMQRHTKAENDVDKCNHRIVGEREDDDDQSDLSTVAQCEGVGGRRTHQQVHQLKTGRDDADQHRDDREEIVLPDPDRSLSPSSSKTTSSNTR